MGIKEALAVMCGERLIAIEDIGYSSICVCARALTVYDGIVQTDTMSFTPYRKLAESLSSFKCLFDALATKGWFPGQDSAEHQQERLESLWVVDLSI
jgi:hypothetical protein